VDQTCAVANEAAGNVISLLDDSLQPNGECRLWVESRCSYLANFFNRDSQEQAFL